MLLGRLFATTCVLFALTGSADGFEVGAIIRKFDVEKRTAVVFAGGQERSLRIAGDAKFLDETGRDLDEGIHSQRLKPAATVTLTVERADDGPMILAIRLGGKVQPPGRAGGGPKTISVGKSSVGFKPLTEMTADDRYKGHDGGLYGGGRNDLPKPLAVAATERTSQIKPLDADGRPAEGGTIGLVSISMSNATQEFSRFKQLADADPDKSSRVAIVDCAQGGQTMARWADASGNCWTEADRRLKGAGVSHQQVQVAWIKLANAGPSGDLADHGKQLQQDTLATIANLRSHFPNLRIAYLGSRIYGGWADGRLNPEPYAYEGAFVARQLILDQLGNAGGDSSLPLLLWGPYLWADGTTPRNDDGLVWLRADLVADGTHPSDSGRQKVAEQLLAFFKTDAYAKTWFVKQ